MRKHESMETDINKHFKVIYRINSSRVTLKLLTKNIENGIFFENLFFRIWLRKRLFGTEIDYLQC